MIRKLNLKSFLIGVFLGLFFLSFQVQPIFAFPSLIIPRPPKPLRPIFSPKPPKIIITIPPIPRISIPSIGRRLTPIPTVTPTATPSPTSSPTPSPTPTPTVIPQSFYIVSDVTWKYSDSEVNGWYMNDYDDSSWLNTIAPSAGLCPVNQQEVPVRIGENGALPMWSANPKNNATAYFRKHFILPYIATGTIRAVLDDEGDIYINGQLVLRDTIADGRDLTSGDVTQYLHPGENVIAMRVFDSRGYCQTVQFDLKLTPK